MTYNLVRSCTSIVSSRHFEPQGCVLFSHRPQFLGRPELDETYSGIFSLLQVPTSYKLSPSVTPLPMCLVFAIPPGSDPLRAKMSVCDAVRSAKTVPRFVPHFRSWSIACSYILPLQREGSHRLSRERSCPYCHVIPFAGSLLRCAYGRFLAFPFCFAISLVRLRSSHGRWTRLISNKRSLASV